MFNRKKIIDLQMRVSELEAKADVLADRLSKAYKEIELIYLSLTEMTPVANPVTESKPNPKSRRYKKKTCPNFTPIDGKENTKATK